MINDIEYLERSGVLKMDVQKDLYNVKRQKDYIDEKIYEIQNRVKFLEDQEKKQAQIIYNQIQTIKKKHQVIDFKEKLYTIKRNNQYYQDQLQQVQHQKAQSFRDQHKQIIKSVQENILKQKKTDALNLQIKKQNDHEDFMKDQNQKFRERQSLASQIKQQQLESQDKINKYWKTKLNSFSVSKLNRKNNISIEAECKEKILNNLINQENKHVNNIQESIAKRAKLKQILNNNDLLLQINIGKIEKTDHLRNSLPIIQMVKD